MHVMNGGAVEGLGATRYRDRRDTDHGTVRYRYAIACVCWHQSFRIKFTRAGGACLAGQPGRSGFVGHRKFGGHFQFYSKWWVTVGGTPRDRRTARHVHYIVPFLDGQISLALAVIEYCMLSIQ